MSQIKEAIEKKIKEVAKALRHCELQYEVEPNPEIATAGDRPPEPIIVLGASELLAQELDQALALLRAEEPEAGEFTKKVRQFCYLAKGKTMTIREFDEIVTKVGLYLRDCLIIIDRQAAELRKLTGHLEQALLYTDPPHPVAKERIKEAQEYLNSLTRGKDAKKKI